MFNKRRFKELLVKAIENGIKDNVKGKAMHFAKKSGVNRTYISKYLNEKLDSPPAPEILKRIASSSNGSVSYEELMKACDYIIDGEELHGDIKKARLNIESLAHNIGLEPEVFKKILKAEGDVGNDDYSKLSKWLGYTPDQTFLKIPVLGIIRAGEPIRAEQNIIGYEYLPEDMIRGGQYFGLKVIGDSMDAAKISDGNVAIVREQPEVENGDIAVVIVDGENATVKRFYKTNSIVTLMPDSSNKEHQPRFIDITKEDVKVLGKVVKVVISL